MKHSNDQEVRLNLLQIDKTVCEIRKKMRYFLGCSDSNTVDFIKSMDISSVIIALTCSTVAVKKHFLFQMSDRTRGLMNSEITKYSLKLNGQEKDNSDEILRQLLSTLQDIISNKKNLNCKKNFWSNLKTGLSCL